MPFWADLEASLTRFCYDLRDQRGWRGGVNVRNYNDRTEEGLKPQNRTAILCSDGSRDK